MLIAGRRLHAHHQAQTRQHIGMVHMGGTPRLFGIVADNSAFLVPIKKFDAGALDAGRELAADLLSQIRRDAVGPEMWRWFRPSR